MSTGKRHALVFKAKVALGALKGAQMVADRASRFRVHPTLTHSCKKAVLNGASGVFERGSKKAPEFGEEPVMAVHPKIREFAVAKLSVQRTQTVDRQVRRK